MELDKEGVVRPSINLDEERMQDEVVIHTWYGRIFDEGAGKCADVLCQEEMRDGDGKNYRMDVQRKTGILLDRVHLH